MIGTHAAYHKCKRDDQEWGEESVWDASRALLCFSQALAWWSPSSLQNVWWRRSSLPYAFWPVIICSARVHKSIKNGGSCDVWMDPPSTSHQSLSSLYSSRTQARSTYILLLCSCTIVYFDPYGFYIWFPHFIWPSMGMAHFDTKMRTLTTNRTFCHGCTSFTHFSAMIIF